MKMPTYKEIDNKIKQAADALELAYDIRELADILLELFQRVKPGDYTGALPAQPSYEDEIFQGDLYAFTCACSRFGCDIYFKFALKNDTFWLVSLHKYRPEKREKP